MEIEFGENKWPKKERPEPNVEIRGYFIELILFKKNIYFIICLIQTIY